MRNILLLVVLLFSFSNAFTQPTLDKVVGKYFRVNLIDRPFNVFLSQVINDTALTITKLEKRTDTSLFYLQGNYNSFSPFTFKTQVVQLIISDFIVTDDSTKENIDTLINCRISATTLPAAGKEQQEQVRNEYRVINRKNKRSIIFSDERTVSSTDNKSVEGQVSYFYATSVMYIPFLTVSWGQVLGKENFAFTMQLIVK